MRTLLSRKSRRAVLFVAAVALLAGLVAVPARASGGGGSAVAAGREKLAPALAAVLENGSAQDARYASVVKAHVPGTVYYLAKLRSLEPQVLAELRRQGATVRAQFPLTNLVALSSQAAVVRRVVALASVTRLYLDDIVQVASISTQALSPSAATPFGDQTMRGTHDIGADAMWAAGIEGGGVTVGVADTGVDSTHPDIASHLTGFSDCSGVVPNLAGGIVSGPAVPATPADVGQCVPAVGYDDNGHGTHVSGIATGSATLEPSLPGVAPAAKLKVAKVCSGAGTCLNSAVLAGIQDLAVNGAQVINLSLGGDRSYLAGLSWASQVTNVDNPETELVDALADRYNVVFSIAAGNSGPTLQSVGSPAVAGQAMAVAASVTDWDLAHTKDETLHGVYGPIRPDAAAAGASAIAQFSSRGPSGDRLIKPEVSAPGSYVVSAEAATGGEVKAGDAATGHKFSNDPFYAVLSGTSMAAPSNAGAAALVIDGYHRATGADPLYYVVKAALAGTAHPGAFEGPVTGLLSSIRATRLGEDPAALFPIRNQREVGVTGEGAGRIYVPDAYLAATAGVVAYTPAERVGGKLTARSLQPNWSLDQLAPGESAQQTFLVRGGPALAGPAPVAWSFEPDSAVVGVGSIQQSWVTLPAPTAATAGAETLVSAGLKIPDGTAPGLYSGTIVGTATLGSAVQRLRLPVQVFVPLLNQSSTDAPIFATGPTDYSVVGLESPIGGIATDWVMYPMRLAAGTSKVTLSVFDPAAKAHMDVFAFDERGQEIDSSVSPYLEQAVPGDVALAPTGPSNPNEVVLFDGNDFNVPKLPTTIWVVVSDTVPGTAPGFEAFHLDTKVVTGATTTTAPAGLLPGLPPAPVAASAGAGSRARSVPASASDGLDAALAANARRGGSSVPEPTLLFALLLDAAVLAGVTRRLSH